MKKGIVILLALAGILAARPFEHKLIFAERPRTAEGWHAGVRNHSLLIWDVFASHNKYGVLDYLYTGMPGGDLITDQFSSLTYRSPVYRPKLCGRPCGAALGFKYYRALFGVDEETVADRSYVFFTTLETDLREKNSLLLFGSWSLRPLTVSTGTRTEHTWYLVPGFEHRFGNGNRWRFGFEYYLTNTRELPVKSFQFVFDEDKLDFYNAGREPVSFMVWGVSYARGHFYADLNILSHYTFQGLVFPLLGIGWQF